MGKGKLLLRIQAVDSKFLSIENYLFGIKFKFLFVAHALIILSVILFPI